MASQGISLGISVENVIVADVDLVLFLLPLYAEGRETKDEENQAGHVLVVTDALTEMFVIRVVRESLELVLDRLGEVTRLDNGIDSLLRGEFRIDVGNIKHGFNRWFEGWLDLLSHESNAESTVSHGSLRNRDNGKNGR